MPPTGEVIGGKFMGYFTKMLIDTNYDTSDGTVKNSQKLGGIDSVGWQKRITGSCSADQAIKSINVDGTVSCLDIVSSFYYSWDSSTWSACSVTC